MADLAQDIDALFSDLVTQLSDPGLTGPDREQVLQAAAAIKDEALKNALNEFRAGTAKFTELATKLNEAARKLSSSSLRTRFVGILRKVGDIQAKFSSEDPPGNPKADPANPDPVEPNDEAETKPDPLGDPVISPSGSLDGPVVTDPMPVNSTKFSALEAEYKKLFLGARFRSQAAKDDVLRLCRGAAADRGRYEAVAEKTGVPWWFIAAIHLLESGRNFQRHLHNGDKLTARTVQKPPGRPASGNPPFTWEFSAEDALKLKKFDKQTDWSLARVLYRMETYNGFGYRPRGNPSPYLWSLTTLYKKGKYKSDGVYDPNLVSKQCGVAAFLRGLVEVGAIQAADLTGLDISPADPTESDDVVIQPIPAEPTDPAPGDHAFKAFFESNLPDVTHFRWDEFLTKGSSHSRPGAAGFGLNTDPPASLWPNVIPLARALQRFREEIGAPVKLSSVYRSPAYNKTLDGSATHSLHMDFKAADIVAGSGTPGDWHRLAVKLRSQGVFTGGIGLYRNFIHIDVRGVAKDWRG